MRKISLDFIDKGAEKHCEKSIFRTYVRSTKRLRILICFLSAVNFSVNMIPYRSPEKLAKSLFVFLYLISSYFLEVHLPFFARWVRFPIDSMCLILILTQISQCITPEGPSFQVGAFLQGLYLSLYLWNSDKNQSWHLKTIILIVDCIIFLAMNTNMEGSYMIFFFFPLVAIFALTWYSKEKAHRNAGTKRNSAMEKELKFERQKIFEEMSKFDAVAAFKFPLKLLISANRFKFPSIEEVVGLRDQYSLPTENADFIFNKSTLFYHSDKLSVDENRLTCSNAILEAINQPVIEAVETKEIFNIFSNENLSITDYFHHIINDHVTEEASANDNFEYKFKPIRKKLNCLDLSGSNLILSKFGPRFRVFLNSFSLGQEVLVLITFRKENEKKKLKELLKSQKEMSLFLASIVHDLRSPLIGVEYMIEAAADDVANKQNYLKIAKSNCQLLSCLIDDILDFTSSNNNKFRIVLSYFSLNDLINEVVAIMKPDADLRKVSLEYTNPFPYDLTVNSDSKRLKQILINLISNALKFTTVGSVSISARKKDDYIIEIHVIDTGCGIKKELIGSLSEPYFSLDNEAGANKRGIGLGLHNCKQILSFLGPEGLHVNSVEGKGSDFSFFIYRDIHNQSSQNLSKVLSKREIGDSRSKLMSKYLTLHSMSLDELGIDMIKPNIVMQQRNNFSSIKRPKTECSIRNIKRNSGNHLPVFSVLIVDDNPFNLLVLEKYLKSFDKAEIKIEKCFHGEGAVECFRAQNAPGSFNPFQLAILDIQLPFKNGFEVSEEINELINREGFERCSIHGISSLVEESHLMRSITTGMKSLLPKPTNMQTIHKICEELFIF